MLTACPLRVLRWLAVLFYARVCIFFINTRQLVASVISLATSFFLSGQNSSRAHSAASRFQPRPAALGSRLGAALRAAFFSILRNIDFNRPFQDVLTKEMHSKNTALLCGVFAFLKRKAREQDKNVEKSDLKISPAS